MRIILGEKLIKLAIVQSTNNYAFELIHNCKTQEKSSLSGTVIWADEQIAGRGQQTNYWESERNKNLTLSIILFPENFKAEDQFSLSKLVALGVRDFLSNYVKDVQIKWPNDIYINDKKIAGILIENSIMGGFLTQIIIGIGINVNQDVFLSKTPNPVSLKLITGIDYELDNLLKKLLNSLETYINQYYSRTKDDIDVEYLNCLYRYKIPSKFKDANKEFIGIITGITQWGELLIEKEDAQIVSYYFKEISFVL